MVKSKIGGAAKARAKNLRAAWVAGTSKFQPEDSPPDPRDPPDDADDADAEADQPASETRGAFRSFYYVDGPEDADADVDTVRALERIAAAAERIADVLEDNTPARQLEWVSGHLPELLALAKRAGDAMKDVQRPVKPRPSDGFAQPPPGRHYVKKRPAF